MIIFLWLKWLCAKKKLYRRNIKKNITKRYPKLNSNYYSNIILKVMALVFQNTLTLNHYFINFGGISFLKLDDAVSLLPKKALFSPFKVNTKTGSNITLSALSAKEKALFCPKTAKKLPKIKRKIVQQLSKNLAKHFIKNFFWKSVKNFFETVRPKIRSSKKSVRPFVQKSVRHEKGPFIGAQLSSPLVCWKHLLNSFSIMSTSLMSCCSKLVAL